MEFQLNKITEPPLLNAVLTGHPGFPSHNLPPLGLFYNLFYTSHLFRLKEFFIL